MYQKKTYDLGWMKMIEKSYPGNYGAPGKPRSQKQNKSPDVIEKQNERIRARNLQLLIAANFKEGDFHLTLTYRQDMRPADPEEAKQRLKTFEDRMRIEYKKRGLQFKWIHVTEIGSRGAVHHHLVIENIQEVNTTALVQKLWPYGHQNFSPLYTDGEFEQLADYLQKKESKERVKGCRYSHSRNLIIPKPKIEKIHRRKWNQDPKPERGWYVVKDSVINGVNPYTQMPFQKYTVRKMDTRRRRP